MRLHPDLRARSLNVYSTGRAAWTCGMRNDKVRTANQWRVQERGVTVVLAQNSRCLKAVTALCAHLGALRPDTLLCEEEG
jgi:hypothetical protein